MATMNPNAAAQAVARYLAEAVEAMEPDEVEEITATRKLVGHLPPGDADDPEWEPFWARLDELAAHLRAWTPGGGDA